MVSDKQQSWTMADVSEKAVTHRVAIAGGRIEIGETAMGLLQAGQLPKGDPLSMAEIAGVLAAKQTPTLIPLCHPISLNRVIVRSYVRPEENAVDVYCLAEIAEKTGVEMEALTGLNIALLTIWDLVKPVEAALSINKVRLLYKSGGKSGTWRYPNSNDPVVDQLLTEYAD
jgi:cyclic pyranopterin phosphate synthase